VKLKLNIFIHVKTHEELHNYAQIVHLYFSDKTFTKKEAEEWMGEVGCELNVISDSKIVFTFFDDWYPTRITVFKSGRIKVETDLDELP
jgi:hypothetical protein